MLSSGPGPVKVLDPQSRTGKTVVAKEILAVRGEPDNSRLVTIRTHYDTKRYADQTIRVKPNYVPGGKPAPQPVPRVPLMKARVHPAPEPITARYKCVDGKCVKTLDPLAPFATMRECQRASVVGHSNGSGACTKCGQYGGCGCCGQCGGVPGCDHRFRVPGSSKPRGYVCRNGGCVPVYWKNRRTTNMDGHLYSTPEECALMCACQGSVMIFDERNYGGRHQSLRPGRYRVNSLVGCYGDPAPEQRISDTCRSFKDRVRSVIVPEGMVVRLWTLDDFTGKMLLVDRPMSDLGNLRVASVEVLDAPSASGDSLPSCRPRQYLSGRIDITNIAGLNDYKVHDGYQ